MNGLQCLVECFNQEVDDLRKDLFENMSAVKVFEWRKLKFGTISKHFKCFQTRTFIIDYHERHTTINIFSLYFTEQMKMSKSIVNRRAQLINRLKT